MKLIPSWVLFRKASSGLLALFLFALMYPNTIDHQGNAPFTLIVLVLCCAVVPFALIVNFAGKNKKIEYIGWIIQLYLLASYFI
jgi:hypothetical protein